MPETHFDLMSDDPQDPLYRLRVSGPDEYDSLFTIAEENLTSTSPTAQVTSVRTALDLCGEEARWLHEKLGVLLNSSQVDTASAELLDATVAQRDHFAARARDLEAEVAKLREGQLFKSPAVRSVELAANTKSDSDEVLG
jgi:hypothetical protein